jgi:putative ABC transport system substrate-binding protein
MRRREFIAGLGSAVAWPVAVRAQQPAMPVIGYLSFGTPREGADGVETLRKSLSEMGFVEGRNLAIEFRWAQNDVSRLPELAAELVRHRVAVITTVGGTATLAVKALTNTIPVVFGIGGDPIKLGIVANLNRPGANITGITVMGQEVDPKRLELLHQLLPRATRLGVLINPVTAYRDTNIAGLRAAAAAIGSEIEFFYASTGTEIDTAFTSLVQKCTDAVLITNQFLFRDRRAQIHTLAARYAVPVIYVRRQDVEDGGLISYGPSTSDPNVSLATLGIYVGRILKGEKPGDLPVQQPARFELVINLTTAKALGLTIPETLLATADEVIQ